MFSKYPQLLRKSLSSLIQAQYGFDGPVVVERPRDRSKGDWASPIALMLAKQGFSGGPMEIAQAIAGTWNAHEEYSSVARCAVAAPGFLNFSVPESVLVGFVAAATDPAYGKQSSNGTSVIVEFSSPNIAKEMHVGHLRGTVTGPAISNILETRGHKVIRASHLGDWGKQFGILIDQYVSEYGEDLAAVKTLTVPELERMYVKWNTENKTNEDRHAAARQWLVKLQAGDAFAYTAWKSFCTVSMANFERLYARLGVSFTEGAVRGESSYNNDLPGVVELAKARGAVDGESLPDGSRPIVLPLDEYGIKTPMMVRKADGGYLYHTTDLATIAYRKKEYDKPTGTLVGVRYIVGSEQTLHFKQLFAGARKVGLLSDVEASQWRHVPYELILGEQGKKFSTRNGSAIRLEELLDRAISYAVEVTKEKNPDLGESEVREIAERIGVGSLKFFILAQNRNTSFVFDWDRVLDVHGNSAAYLLYTHARIVSLLEKTDEYNNVSDSDAGMFVAESKPIRDLLVEMHTFDFTLDAAARDDAPNILCAYALDLAGLMTTMYHEKHIGSLPDAERGFRRAVLQAADAVLMRSLQLLGIETVDRI